MATRHSFQAKLLLRVMPVLVLGLVGLAIASYRYVHRLVEEELMRGMAASTAKSAEAIDAWLGMLLLEPESIAATPAAQSIQAGFAEIDALNVRRHRLLHERRPELFRDIYAADATGAYHTVVSDGKGGSTFFLGNIADRPYFRSIMAGGPAQITPPLVSRTTGEPTLFAVAPIRDSVGQPVGLIGAGISLERVQRIAESLRVGEGGYGFILAQDGTILFHPDPALAMRRKVWEMGDASVQALGRAMLSGGAGTVRYTYQGVEKVAFYQPIRLAGWSVATTIPAAELFAPATRMLRYTALTTAAIALLVALAIALATRRLTRPLGAFARHVQASDPDRALAEFRCDSGDEVATLAGAYNQLARRLHGSLETLRASEEEHRGLVENVGVGIFRSRPRPEEGFTRVNPALLALLQPGAVPPAALRLSHLFVEAEQRDGFLGALEAEGRVQDQEVVLRRGDGSTVWCRASARAKRDPQGRIEWIDGVLEDVSVQRRLEEQLRHSQKLEAVGTLAGGVAHDFNNLLTAIIGCAHLAQEAAGGDEALADHLAGILDAAGKASGLTRSLLAFSRRQVMSLRPTSVNEVVQGVERLLVRVIGEDVSLRVALSGDAPVVMGDAGQLEQVLLNLATNARDAMPGGGTLSISTGEAVVADDPPASLSLRPGRYAVLAVADTGQGMDERTRRRIFEPFFTTKEPGRGTGLGLAIVYGIVRQHGGEVSVYSEPGAGTTFRIYLRRVDAAPASDSARPAAPPPGGTETVLLAEDDPGVRSLYAAVLRRAGYTVVEASDGAEAVESFGRASGTVHLLLLDVVMPRLNGREACGRIRAQAPGVRILYSSGYTREIVQQRNLFEEGAHFLTKPATPAELLAAVRRALDQPPPRPDGPAG